eukprot:6198244-Pleurochrysis_carterae.AAC.2
MQVQWPVSSKTVAFVFAVERHSGVHLKALAARSKLVRRVDALARAARVVGGHVPEREKLLLGRLLAEEVGAAVVHTIVVVIPSGHVRLAIKKMLVDE